MSRSQVIIVCVLIVGSLWSVLVFSSTWNNGDPNIASTDCEKYTSSSERLVCWHEFITDLVSVGQTATALDQVAELYKAEPDFQGQCHDFMHTIGEESYYRFQTEQEFSVNENISLCTYGFYHGFLDTLIQTTGDYQEAREFCGYLNGLLTTSGLSSDTLVENCYHGIGHGTIDEHRPDQNTDPYWLTSKTVQLCKTVTATNEQLHDCVTGVFNGIANFYADRSFGWDIDPNDPVAICRDQETQFKGTCYAYMARVILELKNHDTAAAISAIAQHVESIFVPNVILNLTLIHVTKNSAMSKVEQSRLITECQALNSTDNRNSCIQGLAAGYVQAGDPSVPFDAVTNLCFDQQLVSDESTACLEYAYGNIVQWYTEIEVESYCQQLHAEFGTSCSNG